MPGRPEDPRWAVFITCILSHLPMVGGVLYLLSRRFRFEAVVGAYAVVTSFMYHVCECFQRDFFLSELKWHRLDNIGAITAVGCSCIQLSCFEDKAILDYMQYVTLFTVVILQEAAPWDITYTVAPIALCMCVPIYAHITSTWRRQGLVLRRVGIGLSTLALAAIFFVVGLDDQHDPLRIFHGLFHVCIAATLFFFFHSLRPPSGRKKSSAGYTRYDEPVNIVKHPWDVRFTVAPVILFSLFPVVKYCFVEQRLPAFKAKPFLLGILFCSFALPLFVLGLREQVDPYRMYHGGWHFFMGLAAFFFWVMVKTPGCTGRYGRQPHPIVVKGDALL